MIKVHFQNEEYADLIKVYIVDHFRQDGKSYLLQFGKFNNTWVELKECKIPPEPTFRFRGIEKTEFLKAMADAIAEIGIKTDSDFKIQGKLEATEKHLEDMRRLIFKNKTDVTIKKEIKKLMEKHLFNGETK